MGEMGMIKLYKGKYLIALYNKDDRLVDVGVSPRELEFFKNRTNSFYEMVSRGDKMFHGCTLHLIDCPKKHNDVFKEEDEIFLREMRCVKNKCKEVDKIAKQLGVSRATVYKLKSQGNLKGF
jgi:DNA invertase Pin-like site-specific DNA recombinase